MTPSSLTGVVVLGLVLLTLYLRFGKAKPKDVNARPWGARDDRDRNLEAISTAFRVSSADPPEPQSDRTWHDLSLTDVFAKIDRCVSSLGQQSLYKRLRGGISASFDAASLNAFDERVSVFETNADLRASFQRALAALSSNGSLDLAPMLYGAPPLMPRFAKLFRFATLATIGSGLLAIVWPMALVLFLACVMTNIAIRIQLHNAMTTQSPALLAIVQLTSIARSLGDLKGLPASEVLAIRAALAEIEPYAKSLRWATMDASQLNEFVSTIITYINILFLADVNAYCRSIHFVRHASQSLISLFETMGDLDSAYSIASFRAGTTTWSKPAFAANAMSETNAISAFAMRHPLLDEDCAVANDVHMIKSTEKGVGWLVLGSNAAGKSTFAKGLALQAVLAQSIATTTCKSYNAPLLLVRTIIQIEDHIMTGRSHFLVEAEAARDMLIADKGISDGRERLCVVDELFRGTNTVDRVAAGSAFLRALRRDGAFVVAATHDAELIGLLEGEYQPHYFQEVVTGDNLEFDYTLHVGAVAPRNALAVLALVGFPAEVIADAKSRALSANRDEQSPLLMHHPRA